jgi:hypothetical protein
MYKKYDVVKNTSSRCEEADDLPIYRYSVLWMAATVELRRKSGS